MMNVTAEQLMWMSAGAMLGAVLLALLAWAASAALSHLLPDLPPDADTPGTGGWELLDMSQGSYESATSR